MKFYSLKNILKKQAVYYMIFGERSNGKTFAALKHGLEKYFQDGSQMVYIRRWREDVIGKRASQTFSSLVDEGIIEDLSNGQYTGVTYRNGKYFVCTYDDNGKAIYSDEDCIGYPVALTETEHNKSNAYPRVKTIIFDEFLTKHLYLPDEFVLFMNTISTIVRQRTDVEIFMLGNTVNKYCPYFAEMGLNHIPEMKQGTIDVYSYGESKLTVAIEYCSSLEKQKKNNFYFAFNNPKLEMITGGAWELNIYPHLPYKYKPKNVQFIYFIEFNDNLFQCEMIEIDEILFTYIHRKTTEIQDDDNDLIYSLDYIPKMNYNRNVLKPITKLQQKIKWFYDTDRVFFQNNDVGDTVQNYLKICKQGGK